MQRHHVLLGCSGDSSEPVNLQMNTRKHGPYRDAWTENILTRGWSKAESDLGQQLTEPGLSPLDELGSLWLRCRWPSHCHCKVYCTMSGFSPDFRSCRKLSREMTTQAAGILESSRVLCQHLMDHGTHIASCSAHHGTHIASCSAHCVSGVDTILLPRRPI